MERHWEWVERLRQAVLGSRGATAPAVRQAVEQRAAEIGGRTGGEPGESGRIPPDLSDYVDKVVRHADQVTDEDIARLRQAGYSEDAIFEVTIAAALGAGMGRLERGLAALEGDS